jgi:hypothetical protein
MTYHVAVRYKRYADYVAHSEHDHYGLARLEQLTQKGRYYDAQIYSADPYDRSTLIFAPPKATQLVHPYDRLELLFSSLWDAGMYRCLVSRPSLMSGSTAHRVYLYSFARRLNYVDSTVYAVELRRDANAIQPYNIRYHAQSDPPYLFTVGQPYVEPVHAGRMEGVWIADLAAQFKLYFGYVETPSEDPAQIVEQIRIDSRNLYDL